MSGESDDLLSSTIKMGSGDFVFDLRDEVVVFVLVADEDGIVEEVGKFFPATVIRWEKNIVNLNLPIRKRYSTAEVPKRFVS
ncbi:hypothetical protein TNCV_3435581 [Trichonephila clavipes]|nr:hypothetical protein TNCV_3435581 [Trichonephila clavipes]